VISPCSKSNLKGDSKGFGAYLL